MDKSEFLVRKRQDIIVSAVFAVVLRAVFLFLFFVMDWMSSGNWLLGISGFLFPIATIFAFSIVHYGFLSSVNIMVISFLFMILLCFDMSSIFVLIGSCFKRYYHGYSSRRGGYTPP